MYGIQIEKFFTFKVNKNEIFQVDILNSNFSVRFVKPEILNVAQLFWLYTDLTVAQKWW